MSMKAKQKRERCLNTCVLLGPQQHPAPGRAARQARCPSMSPRCTRTRKGRLSIFGRSVGSQRSGRRAGKPMRADFDTPPQDWNAETIACLRVLWAEGHSTAEIGRRMGLTKNSIVGKAHRLQLPPRPSPIRYGQAGKPEAVPKLGPQGDQPLLSSAPSDAVCGEQIVQKLKAAAKSSKRKKGRSLSSPKSSSPVSSGQLDGYVRGPVPKSCCWPLGEPGQRDFHFCGASATPGKPYCSEHAKIAYVKLDDRRDGSALDRELRKTMKVA